MKRILIATVIVMGISHAATAQTSGSSSANSPGVSSSRTKAKTGKSKKGQASQPDSLNQRKMYNWKDGQRATPTGHEATGMGGSAATLPKDSATVATDSTRQHR